MASEKVTNMVGTFLKEDSTRSQFKIAIGYTYQDVVSESVQVLATQVASEKVANMVATFLKEDNSESQFKRSIGYTYQANG